MKVRIKESAHCTLTGTHQVLQESADYYILPFPGGFQVAVAKQQCDIIPEPTWRDVTAECIVTSDGFVRHRGLAVASPERSGYRLRKVKLHKEMYQEITPGHYQILRPQDCEVDACIIEHHE